MAILYEFQRVEPMIDPETNKVIAWVIGLRGTDIEDPAFTAYVDEQVPVPQANQKPLEEWSEEEIRNFAMAYAIREELRINEETGEKEYEKRNWFNLIKAQIEAQKGNPIRGSHIVI